MILLIVVFSMPITSVKAATTRVYSLSNADNICDAIKTNDRLKIFVYSFYDKKSYQMKSSTTGCVNADNYTSMKDKIAKGTTWVQFGRSFYNRKVYSDNKVVKYENEYGKYAPFYISNSSKNNGDTSLYTLNPGEKTFMILKTSDLKLTGSSYSDLRLFIDYEPAIGFDIATFNAMSYYVQTKEKMYGPYKIAKEELIYTYNVDPTAGTEKKVYRLASDNLIKDIPDASAITAIRMYPYENYNFHRGIFRVFGMFINGYTSTYGLNKKYVKVSGAENTLRHNIVNNFLEEATIKWNVNSTSPDVYFYHHFTTNPVILSKKDKFYYGIPYVNNTNATISKFISKTTKNTITTTNKASTPYYSYNFITKYPTDVTTLTGKNIKSGTSVGKTLYIFEKNSTNDEKTTSQRYKDKNNKNLNFVLNSEENDYIQGLDCSASTFLANARELPYEVPMNYSHRYYDSFEHRILGGLSITPTEVENYVRNKGWLKKTEDFNNDVYTAYYAKYMSQKYKSSPQKVYNAFGLVVPGDIVDTKGHVRLVSGYPHVECNNGKVITKYKDGGCGSSGINPDKSYVITMEVGGAYTIKDDPAHIKQSETGWTYSFNKNLTDITSVDQLYNKNNKFLSIFNLNKKYTFRTLFNVGYDYEKGSGIYLPFRYKAMDIVSSGSKIELPNIRVLLDKTYDNVNQGFINRTADYKTLQGTIVSNYMLDVVKIEVNGKAYKFYPQQKNDFSLRNDISSTLKKVISGLDYKKSNTIRVYVSVGPKDNTFKTSAGVDKDGYIKVLDTSGLTPVLTVKTTKVAFTTTSINLNLGASRTLKPTVSPSNAEDKTIKWTSSGSKVVSVSSTGVIKALKVGKVTITATTRDTGKIATLIVNVVKPVESVAFSSQSLSVTAGSKKKASYTITPSDATNKGVTFTSANTSIATVDTSGNVTGVKVGTTTVTVTTNDGKKTSTITIKVVAPNVHVTGVSLGKSSTTVNLNKTETLKPVISPSNATNKAVTYKSSDTTIATVSSSGVVTGKKVGKATITVTTTDASKTATISVNVVQPKTRVTKVGLNKTTTTLKTGSTEKIKATITPSDATNKTVIWSSSNTKVATVSATGEITASTPGTATITATSADNGVKSTLLLTVEKLTVPVTKVALSSSVTNVDVGEFLNVNNTITPTNATDKSLVWTSSDTRIASVDTTGKVYAVSPGKVNITAKSTNGIVGSINIVINGEVKQTDPVEVEINEKKIIETAEVEKEEQDIEIKEEVAMIEKKDPIPQSKIDEYTKPSNSSNNNNSNNGNNNKSNNNKTNDNNSNSSNSNNTKPTENKTNDNNMANIEIGEDIEDVIENNNIENEGFIDKTIDKINNTLAKYVGEDNSKYVLDVVIIALVVALIYFPLRRKY